ncbi:MAG: hypothetical protein U0M06_00225 [Clostridia bacterium]|nr:hypothetical protein [Clostridia bacterium]
MASTIDLSGLEHYIKTLTEYGTKLKDFRKAIIALGKSAKKFAEEKYAEHGHSSIKVEFEPHGTTATIYAKGNAVAFFEFGTGEYASGSYKGSIPQSGVPITEKWEYYYEEPASGHKVTLNGVKGWFWKGNFVTGNKAEAEMWETSQYIRQQAHLIFREYFQKESGAV